MHDYLAMDPHYHAEDKVDIDMTDYISKVLKGMTKKHKVHNLTPEANHLFKVNKRAEKLSEVDAQNFHTLVAKLIFLIKREWPGMLTSIAFIMKRVSETDINDEKKLI